eukprot:CAMPEP_0118921832 /NCGR_PEP_ID=MMETSP1169-20130426/985_1 /TAXON_ID=36882 /ORGANISM="Pyramimonas obovata, Strain CCMP722" /LENGTH=329 /DNA_ID=CAMNT_0006862623 /DNA_START=189 /DNA_END=1174 /DNA_ORIENTATION=+
MATTNEDPPHPHPPPPAATPNAAATSAAAHNRSVDAKTNVEPASTQLADAITDMDFHVLAASWMKLYGRFHGTNKEDDMSLKKFIDTFVSFTNNRFTVKTGDFSTEAIFTEYRSADEVPTFVREANVFVFHLLNTVCDGNAYDIVSPYGNQGADESVASSYDGRRAWLALLRTLAPISSGQAAILENELKSFQFTTKGDDVLTSLSETKPRVQHRQARNQPDLRNFLDDKRKKKAAGARAERTPPTCKYCPGQKLHWHRDCPTLAKLEQPATIGAAVADDDDGFLFAAQSQDPVKHSANDPPMWKKVFGAAIRSPLLWLGHSATSQGGV